MSINESFLRSVLEQNFTTLKGFIEIMFKDVKQDVKELREENEELRKSLTFPENNSTFVMNKLSDVSERVRVLGPRGYV